MTVVVWVCVYVCKWWCGFVSGCAYVCVSDFVVLVYSFFFFIRSEVRRVGKVCRV